LHAQARTLALNAKASFGKTVPPAGNEKGLLIIPATIEVALNDDAERTVREPASQRLSRLMSRLDSSNKRVDLAELTVIGNGNSIASSTIVLNLWAGQEAAK